MMAHPVTVSICSLTAPQLEKAGMIFKGEHIDCTVHQGEKIYYAVFNLFTNGSEHIFYASVTPEPTRCSYPISNERVLCAAAQLQHPLHRTLLEKRAEAPLIGDASLYTIAREEPAIIDLLPEFPWAVLNYTKGAPHHAVYMEEMLSDNLSDTEQRVFSIMISQAERIAETSQGRWRLDPRYNYLHNYFDSSYVPPHILPSVQRKRIERKEEKITLP
jgi:hypothetical protein